MSRKAPSSVPPPPGTKAREALQGLHLPTLPHKTFLFPQARLARPEFSGTQQTGPCPPVSIPQYPDSDLNWQVLTSGA